MAKKRHVERLEVERKKRQEILSSSQAHAVACSILNMSTDDIKEFMDAEEDTEKVGFAVCLLVYSPIDQYIYVLFSFGGICNIFWTPGFPYGVHGNRPCRSLVRGLSIRPVCL